MDRLGPRLEAFAREPPRGQDPSLGRDQFLEALPPLPERFSAPVLPVEFEEVEGDEEGRCRQRTLGPRAQPLEPRDVSLVVDGHLPVEDDRVRSESREGCDEFRESRGEVLALATDEPHLVALLADHHAVAVDFFLVDPARVMNRARYERRLHERYGGSAHLHFTGQGKRGQTRCCEPDGGGS